MNTGKEICGEFQMLKSRRSNWEWHWQEVADLVLPTRDFTVERAPGDRRRNKVYDSTPVNACAQLAAAMHGLMTNPATRWLAISNEDKDWAYEAATVALGYLGSEHSGAATSLHEVYQDLAAFGTGCMCIHTKEGDTKYPVRFSATPLAGIFVQENDQGEITLLIRCFKLTDQELLFRFPETCPDDIRRRVMDGKSDPMIANSILHRVAHRDFIDPGRDDALNKPWSSHYVHEKTGTVLRESGFNRNPYLFVRWSKAPGEVYGRGPGMDMLPDIKTLNVMMRTLLIAGEKATDPPIAVPANGFDGPIRTAPGSINYMRAGMRDKPEAIFTGSDPRIGHEILKMIRGQIEQAFFLDLFRLPELDRMTATEVIERRQQRLQLMSPVLVRCYAELLTPLVESTIEGLTAAKVIRKPDSASKIEFVSPMSVSQKASEINGFMQLLQIMTPLMTTDPEIVDSLDSDYAFRKYGATLNIDPKVIRSKNEVRIIKENRQKAQQMASLVESAKAVRDTAAASKDFASARGGGLNVVA